MRLARAFARSGGDDDGTLRRCAYRGGSLRATCVAVPSEWPPLRRCGRSTTLSRAYRNVLLLGAFAGLRPGEIAARKRSDVDWTSPSIGVRAQHDGAELKTEASAGVVPIPAGPSNDARGRPGGYLHRARRLRPRRHSLAPERRVGDNARHDRGSPRGFRIQDFRQYFASLLIAAGLDIKVVQTQMRLASPGITLTTYASLARHGRHLARGRGGRSERTKEPPGCGPGGLFVRFCGLNADQSHV